MADYTNLSNTQLSSDKPLTQTVARALRDNAVAISEGADGAPRILPRAIGGFSTGTYLLHNNVPTVQMTTTSGFQVWKQTMVPFDGSYTVKFNWATSSGFGANVQVYVEGVAQGSPQGITGSGEITIDVTNVQAGQHIQICGNGGNAGGGSGAIVSNLRIYSNQSLDFVSIS